MITDYLDVLARELDFDRSLSRCVRQEVEDHLWEAVAADSTGNLFEAQRRAVASFGDARAIAAQFAVASLARRTRGAGVAAVVVIASDLMAMKARVVWYAAAHWAIRDDMKAVRGLVLSIDRYAFWTSIILGLAALAYIYTRKIPAALLPAYQQQLRWFFVLCGAAAAALVVSVVSDGVLTTLQLQGMDPSVEIWVAILTMAIEIACAGFLIFYIRSNSQRAASAAGLLKS
jgi:hypothetical protein